MSSKQNTYQQIIKATSLFGGVQVFNILLSVIKTKVVTIIIGPAGFGILGLFTATVKLILDFTKVGLDKSAVKELAEYDTLEDKTKRNEFIYVLNRVVWITGGLGALLTIIFSKFLSVKTFGDSSYTFGFIWLALAVLFSQLSSGRMAILQGTRQLKQLAKANLLSSFLGLMVSVPLYLLFEISGIVPAIIITYLVSFLVFYLFSKTSSTHHFEMPFKTLLNKSKAMLTLGFTLSFTSLILTLTLWLIQIFIRDLGGLEQVGYYAAGMLIINAYVGMIFNAMATDYFPRLSAINKDNNAIQKVVNEQAEIAILLITPIITLFLLFKELIIQILYTPSFLVITGIVTFGILGTLFKAVSFSLGYVIIAKGHSKVYIKTAIVFNILMLLISVGSYKYGGLDGLGLGLLIYYFIHFLGIKWINAHLYKLRLSKHTLYLLLISCVICISVYMALQIKGIFLRYCITSLLVLVSVVFTIMQLQKRVDFKALIKRGFKK